MTLHWEKCPECGSLGRIDQDQKNGKVSIICTCGHHYTKTQPQGEEKEGHTGRKRRGDSYSKMIRISYAALNPDSV